MPNGTSTSGQFARLGGGDRAIVRFLVDGTPVTALEGDTVLTALLLHARSLRSFEFGRERRAGFCLIGACQDCWVDRAEGGRLRACTTPVADGMAFATRGRDG